jgi:TonB family protein
MSTGLTAILTLSLAVGGAAQTPPPRDPRTAAAAEAEAMRSLDAAVAGKRAPEAAYYQLAGLLEARGESERADAVLLSARDLFPGSLRAQTAAAGVYNRRGDFERTMDALRAVAALQPTEPEPLHRIATFFCDKARMDFKDAAETKLAYILQGIDAENQALALRPAYAEAMTYKNILLRMQANMTANPAERGQLIAEADALRDRVIEMLRAAEPAAKGVPAPPPAPSSAFFEPFDQAVARLQPLRVGGSIRVPVKTSDARPVYPADAEKARVQGVVIVETLIDDHGSVANARVLRSIPLLDAAALDAVSRWRFTPAEIEGRRISLLMTVTVNFTLSPR